MSLFSIQTKPTARVLRQFAAAWLIFFLLAAANQIWRKAHVPLGVVFGAVATVGIAGLARPGIVRWLFIGSSIVAFPIGWVVSQITLALMFYGVVTPMALFWRMRGRDVLQLRPGKDQTTFWMERGPDPPPERYLKQF